MEERVVVDTKRGDGGKVAFSNQHGNNKICQVETGD